MTHGDWRSSETKPWFLKAFNNHPWKSLAISRYENNVGFRTTMQTATDRVLLCSIYLPGSISCCRSLAINTMNALHCPCNSRSIIIQEHTAKASKKDGFDFGYLKMFQEDVLVRAKQPTGCNTISSYLVNLRRVSTQLTMRATDGRTKS